MKNMKAKKKPTYLKNMKEKRPKDESPKSNHKNGSRKLSYKNTKAKANISKV
jgi:hypothetical protein